MTNDTKQVLVFLMQTRNGLQSLTDRLASIRYDLMGSRAEQKAEGPPPAPQGSVSVSDMAFTDGVEYLAGDINKALNRFMEEVEFMSVRVNHKEVAQPSPNALLP